MKNLIISKFIELRDYLKSDNFKSDLKIIGISIAVGLGCVVVLLSITIGCAFLLAKILYG